MRHCLGLNRQEVAELVEKAGEPAYRVQQIMNGIYRGRVQSLDQLSTLPRQFREDLSQRGFAIGSPNIQEKVCLARRNGPAYLVAFADRESVETVWMPEGDGGEAGDGTEAGEAGELSAGHVKARPAAGTEPRFASPARWVAPWTATSA